MKNGVFKSTAGSAPSFSREEAGAAARCLYGLEAEAEPLPSERDQNFYLKEENKGEFVLKIANPEEKQDILDLQNKAMEHLNKKMTAGSCPRLIPAVSGRDMETLENQEGRVHFVRLVSYLPGKVLAEVNPHSSDLLFRVGEFFGDMERSLADFSHPAGRRELIWDLKNAFSVIDEFKRHITDKKKAGLVEQFSRRIRSEGGLEKAGLAMGLIHNDGNDHNIIISPPSREPGSFGDMRVAGIIDFGDMIYTYKLAEAAVVCAYVMLDKRNPLPAACRAAAGYHSRRPFQEKELKVLYNLIQLRLLMSVCISAYQKTLHPGNTYLSVSENPVWKLLERMQRISPDFAWYSFRAACGYPPCPRTSRIEEWLKLRSSEIGPITVPPLNQAGRTVFDLSIGSRWLGNEKGLTPAELMHRKMKAWREKAGETIGIGRYDEARLVYTSDLFQDRTVHLGLDVFMPPGSPVKAPLDGEVHSFRNNRGELDYGPTIILKHRAGGEDIEFYTLYGHLSASSLEGVYPGKVIKKGEIFGWMGDSSENRGWAPHLHFQLIMDMLGRTGDFPGVARADERDVWLSLCPDPNLIAGLPEEEIKDDSLTVPEILRLRKKYLLGALSVSYRKPLKIVRGSGCFLYDHTGRAFLDAVNNVPHVGHEHPRVVDAVNKQLSVLNTNTRYLHDDVVRYARRLAERLPGGLQVCTIVNSGSEANDLALRMARCFSGGQDVVAEEGAYHGNLGSLIDISSYKFNGPGGRGKPPHTQTVVMPDLFRGPYRYGDSEAGKKYAVHVRDAVERIQERGRGLAAFISESLPGCGGQIVFPPGYLEEAYRIIRKAGGVCIADEVQVGFGRPGSCFWGFETQNVIPDIVTLGKPMGNGFPLAAVVTTPRIAEKFAGGMEYFNTYGGSPVACAAGMAVLDVIEQENLQENAQLTGSRIMAGLERLKKKYPLIGDVRGRGLFIGVELVQERETFKPASAQAVYAAERMREEGILVSTDGPDRNVIKIKPPLVFNEENADVLLQTFDRILAEDPLQI
ncbi:MAG: aminotransferase class III-fold pyridoxal phosphate-dependent enzyme [Candidatus Aminicenantes bacterium]